MIRLSVRAAVVAMFCATLLTGCGDGVSRSTVKVTVNSTKVKLEDTDAIAVVFTPDGSGETALASGEARKQPLTANPSAKEAKGVTPGKYKLTVQVTPYAGMAQPAHEAAVKELSSRFDANNSKLTCEVASGKEQTLTIDLDAGTVTSN